MRTSLSLAVVLLHWSGASMLHAQTNPARDLVNPFIGTGGHGHTFPGACVPNGLVQLSPDTRPDGNMDWDGCGGYHYSDSVIYGFSHTHLSGTGVADLCDVLITPVAGSGGMAFDGSATRSRFDHSSEEAGAGYYKVDLLGPPVSYADGSSVQAARPTRIEGSSIRAELTATARVGVHRYLFPKGQAARIILNLTHRDKLLGIEIRKLNEFEVVGERSSSSWAKEQRLFYCIRFSHPIKDEDVMPSNLYGFGAGYGFGALEAPLIVKVGISAVSIEGARANLEAEVPHWDFDLVRKQAEDAWNAKLNKIQVQGGTKEQQRIFYTALYHCYVAPYIFNDVDGKYRGMDGEVHHADHNVYTVFSLWDTFRALHPLMTILEPEMTSDFIKTFLLHYQQGGRLPVWELWGNETDCMIGYHSVSVIADAYMKGIRDFDSEIALEAMVASAMRDEPGLNAYRAKGYISSEDQSESVSRTLEYAYDDWCIAQMAREMGKDSLARVFRRRSHYPENLVDVGEDYSIFYRPRRNGSFLEPFDPYEVNFHYTEANAWQYSQFTPQGGNIGPRHLDSLFSTSSRTTGREQADITGLIGQYAHGNEPSHHMPYIYNSLGYPEKTRALVKRILDEQYYDAPDGLSGNEDCGQMSAWYVMSALGIYQRAPGSPFYDIGYALFDSAVVHLPNGKTWSVFVDPTGALAPQKPAEGEYTASTVSGLKHDDILAGRNVVLRPDRSSHPTWKSKDPNRLAPVEEAWEDRCERDGAPLINAASAVFTDSLVVSMVGCGKCTIEDRGEIRPCSTKFPFVLRNSAIVQVDWDQDLEPVTAAFTKIDGSLKITLESEYANQYAAGGDQALVDGSRGGEDFRTGEWQGYTGQDLVAMIDLGNVVKLKRIGLSLLQDQKSWIWLPKEVTISWSTNQRQWSSRTISHDVDAKAEGGLLFELWTEILNKKARYISIVAKNAGPCPDWHSGKGGQTWIFADEVLIETVP